MRRALILATLIALAGCAAPVALKPGTPIAPPQGCIEQRDRAADSEC